RQAQDVHTGLSTRVIGRAGDVGRTRNGDQPRGLYAPGAGRPVDHDAHHGGRRVPVVDGHLDQHVVCSHGGEGVCGRAGAAARRLGDGAVGDGRTVVEVHGAGVGVVGTDVGERRGE